MGPESEADVFAQAATEHPGAKLLRFLDPGLGYEYILAVPPESPAHWMVRDRDTVEVRRARRKDG